MSSVKKLFTFVAVIVLLMAPRGWVHGESVRDRLNKDAIWQDIEGDWKVVEQTPSPLEYVKMLYRSLGEDVSGFDASSVADEEQFVTFRNEKVYFFSESDIGSGSVKMPIVAIDGKRLIVSDTKLVAAYDQGKTNVELSDGMNYIPLFYEVAFKGDQLVLTTNRIEQFDGPMVYVLEKVE